MSGKTGYVYPFGDYKALATHMVELDQDSSLRTDMARECVEYARTRFSVEAYVDRLLELYQSLRDAKQAG